MPSAKDKAALIERERKLAQRRLRRAARRNGATTNDDAPQAKAARSKRLAKGSDGEARLPRTRAGVPNKLGATAKQLLEDGFEGLGGLPGLIAWGKKNPTEFYRLWGRLIPRDTVVNPGEGLEQMLARLEQQRSGATPIEDASFTLLPSPDASHDEAEEDASVALSHGDAEEVASWPLGGSGPSS